MDPPTGPILHTDYSPFRVGQLGMGQNDALFQQQFHMILKCQSVKMSSSLPSFLKTFESPAMNMMELDIFVRNVML
jgi:hypothetical protein